MSNIYIVTAHTGYNYGTYLQAYAMKKFMGEFADNADIIWQKSFGAVGRDFRLRKIVTIAIRSAFNYRYLTMIKQGYRKNFDAEPSDTTKKIFDDFSKEYLQIKELNIKKLRQLVMNDNTLAVVAGSDQIWNASSMYPDPLYYLQFVPRLKRISYAASFGRSAVPEYNEHIIGNYLKSIPVVSVREEAGAQIVRKLTGRKVPVMPDPTLLVDWNEWTSNEKENTILLYFLDEPDNLVLEDIKNIQKITGFKVKILLHEFEKYRILDDYKVIEAGPKEFVNQISKSRFVCTDSFHASVFSILLGIPFYTYERNYDKVENQNSRLDTLLAHYNLEERLRKKPGDSDSIVVEYTTDQIDSIRKKDIERAHKFMRWALKNTRRDNN